MTGGRQESEVAMPKGDQLQVTVSPMELMKHTEVLLDSLQQAFERPFATVTEQDRYMLALMGVAEFLDAIGAKELYGERFGKLAIAISDLESGRVAPVLSPRPFGKGRPAGRVRGLDQAGVGGAGGRSVAVVRFKACGRCPGDRAQISRGSKSGASQQSQ